MTWTHVKGQPGMGLETQWIFRACDAPLCSLKKGHDGIWSASLLNKSGISTARIVISFEWTLVQAQAICEVTLREMGWEWGEQQKANANIKD